MGPYSSPSEQVLLGGPSRLGESLGRPLWNALATSTGHTFTWGGSFCPLGPPTYNGLRNERAECWGSKRAFLSGWEGVMGEQVGGDGGAGLPSSYSL